jgi:hypothetical protein
MRKWEHLIILLVCTASLWLVSTKAAQSQASYNEINPKWSPNGQKIALERISISGRGWQGIYWFDIFTRTTLRKPIAIPETFSGSESPVLPKLHDFEQYRYGSSQPSRELYFLANEFCWAKNLNAIAQQGYQFIFTQTPHLFVGVIDSESDKVKKAIFVTGETARGIAENHYADWSIDDNIVFVSGEGDALNLYIKHYDNSYLEGNADTTSKAVKLTDIGADGVVSDPKWSPDGNQIVFSLYKQGNTDIYLIKDVKNYLEEKAIEPNTPVPKAEQLTSMPTEEFSSVWSPDGNMIAFYSLVTTEESSTTDKKGAIEVMNTNGSCQRKVVDRISIEKSGPTWLPEQFGNKIIYANNMRDSMWVVDVTSSAQNKIPDSPLSDPPLFSIELKFQCDLDNNKEISENLQKEFKKKHISLPEKPPPQIEKQESRWLITSGNQAYCIRQQEGRLNIYPYLEGYKYGYITGIDCISHPRRREVLLITYSALDEYNRQKIYWEEINRQWWE